MTVMPPEQMEDLQLTRGEPLEEALIHLEAIIEFTLDKLCSLAAAAIPDKYSPEDDKKLRAEFDRLVEEVRRSYHTEPSK